MMDNKILKFFADKIYDELGIVYKEENYYQLETRLNNIAHQLNFADVDVFYKNALNGLTGHALQLLLDVSTNNETTFFRDIKVFNAIEAKVKEMSSKPNRAPISIWSAACSSGQEPYSLAMMLSQDVESLPGQSFRILATDISESVLKRAKDGIYNQIEVQRGLPALKLAKYFEEANTDMNRDPKWRLKSSIKMYVTFRKQNLKHEFVGIDSFDFVLCRNVLIYQNMENKKEIISRLANHVKDGGYLILGGAESLVGLSDAFEMEHVEGAVIYRKKHSMKMAT